MPIVYGAGTRIGWRLEPLAGGTQWPAPTPALVQALWPATSVTINDGAETTATRTRVRPRGAEAYALLQVAPSASIEMQARYEGVEALWAAAVGFMGVRDGAGVVLPQSLGGGAYRHLYEVDARLGRQPWMVGEGWRIGDGLTIGQPRLRRGTLALDTGADVWEMRSAMVAGLTLSASPDGVALRVDLVGHSLVRTGTTNTAATMRALPPVTSGRLGYHELVFRVAPHSVSIPLGSGDVLAVGSWALRVDNQLAASYGRRTGTAPDEYERTQAPVITLTFTPPRHTSAVWETRWADRSVLMADARWTGPTIPGAGVPYQCTLLLPGLQVSNAQLGLDGAGLPVETVQCLGTIPATVAAGFPATTQPTPLAVELVTRSNRHPLLVP